MKQIVGVRFKSNYKTYYYRADIDWDLKQGDSVVVDSPSSGYEVVKVTSVDRDDSSRNLKEIVSKVYDEGFKARIQTDARIKELKAKISRIKSEVCKDLDDSFYSEKNADYARFSSELRLLEDLVKTR